MKYGGSFSNALNLTLSGEKAYIPTSFVITKLNPPQEAIRREKENVKTKNGARYRHEGYLRA